jgi:hypothetical protein
LEDPESLLYCEALFFVIERIYCEVALDQVEGLPVFSSLIASIVLPKLRSIDESDSNEAVILSARLVSILGNAYNANDSAFSTEVSLSVVQGYLSKNVCSFVSLSFDVFSRDFFLLCLL